MPMIGSEIGPLSCPCTTVGGASKRNAAKKLMKLIDDLCVRKWVVCHFSSVATADVVIVRTHGKKEELDCSSLDLLFGLATATSFHNVMNVID
jgi:hypothetical protein